MKTGRKKHGEASWKGKPPSPEWDAWRNMHQRCSNPNHPSYHRYGGRGIRVCDRWKVFENFLDDIGRRPARSFSIDRIWNGGNYEPVNCRWATKKQQANNSVRSKCYRTAGMLEGLI